MDQLPLVGYFEISMRAGVKRPVVTMWRTRYDTFPRPVAELHNGPIFWWPQVKAWLRQAKKLPGCGRRNRELLL